MSSSQSITESQSQRNSDFYLQNIKFLLTWSRIPALTFMEISQDELLNELKVMLKEQLPIEYAIICIEQHHLNEGDQGVHFHAAIKLERRVRKSIKYLAFHDRIPNVQNKTTNADWLRAKDYCRKDGCFIEIGHDNTKKRLELKEKIELIKINSFDSWIENYITCASDVKLWKEVHPVVVKPWSGVRKLYWFYGETGTGKTRKAWKMMKDDVEQSGFRHASISFSGKRFVNGYNGEEVVLIDDLRKTDIELNILLKMLDRYEHICDVKGGFMNWNAQIIYITCHFSPSECYSYEVEGEVKLYDNVNQLIRRLREFGTTIKFERYRDEFHEEVIELELN